jgi:trehalose-phosphatase
MEDFQTQIDEASRQAVLLVATDYDGTLAPIVSDPATAQAHPESIVALKELAAMPQTHVAIISGRPLVQLASHFKGLDRAHLVGSHGSEFDATFTTPLSPQKQDLLRKLTDQAEQIAAKTPGAMVERKPAGIAFHYRNAQDQPAAVAVDELLKSVGGQAGVFVRHGKKIVELSVVKTDKGNALQKLRRRMGASAVIFFGDDLTDEDAFKSLAGPDLGIKVGDGATAAKYRLPGTLDVARLLARIAEQRGAWLAGFDAVPIEHFSLLSDQRTCALVSPRGRISWLCLPRLDSPALFAEIIGGPAAGFFEVCPVSAARPAKQQYVGASFVLQSDWPSLRVTDYLDCPAGRPRQAAGRSDLVRVIEGRGRVKITFAPRINFGLQETGLRVSPQGLSVEGCVEPCMLVAPGIRWSISEESDHDTAVAEVELDGRPLVLELRYQTEDLSAAATDEPQRRRTTEQFWSTWADKLKLPKVATELVRRSALVLRGLSYGPTGVIAAAATTSLPECPGGVRNWDYRYCWPRDGSMGAAVLARLGDHEPAMKFLDWVLGILEKSPPDSLLRPVYSVDGGLLMPEGSLTELAGYRGSRPVRVGNAAAHQVQLDVLSPVVRLILLLAEQGASLSAEHWRLTQSMVAAVKKRWREHDHGIWELRSTRKYHVHSKVSCWFTVNSAIQIAEHLGHGHDDWADLRGTIAQDVLKHGWNEKLQTFCASYGSSDIDAATLSVGLSGLLPPDDPRFASTVAAVERELRSGPVVYRYHYDDGLPGIEGGFNFCTTWLIQAYATLGRWDDARVLFEQFIKLAGPTGLMAEEYDPKSQLALGNFPQAYSHIGLINCALLLDGAPK